MAVCVDEIYVYIYIDIVMHVKMRRERHTQKNKGVKTYFFLLKIKNTK